MPNRCLHICVGVCLCMWRSVKIYCMCWCGIHPRFWDKKISLNFTMHLKRFAITLCFVYQLKWYLQKFEDLLSLIRVLMLANMDITHVRESVHRNIPLMAYCNDFDVLVEKCYKVWCYICVYMCACVYACMCACAYVCMCVWLCVYYCVCMCVYVTVCDCVWAKILILKTSNAINKFRTLSANVHVSALSVTLSCIAVHFFVCQLHFFSIIAFVHTHTCTHAHTHARAHTHTHTRAHTHTRRHTRAHTHIETHRHARTHRHIDTHTHSLTHKWKRIWKRIHSRTHMHTHICIFLMGVKSWKRQIQKSVSNTLSTKSDVGKDFEKQIYFSKFSFFNFFQLIFENSFFESFGKFKVLSTKSGRLMV